MWDSSRDSEQRGVIAEFRKVLSFSSFSREASTPLTVKVVQEGTQMNVAVEMTGLDLTMGGVLWTALDFFSVPEEPEESLESQVNQTLNLESQDLEHNVNVETRNYNHLFC